MTNMTLKPAILALAVGAMLNVAACGAYQPYADYDTADDAMKGAGMFTGEDGEWVIYASPKTKNPEAGQPSSN